MQNSNTPSRPPQMRPGSSGNPLPRYAPPNPSGGPAPPYGMMTPGGQKRKLESDAGGNPHIPLGPGPGAVGISNPMSAGTSTPTTSQPQPTGSGPSQQPQPQTERKFRPPMPPPHLLASLVPESKMFKDLIDMEQKLDWTMLRKRAEVNDALGRVVKVSRACVGPITRVWEVG